ncbi:MAG: alanine--tRNA ligase, partial [Lachnospiraceae bacterium]|nr:alanine--tRNA ligase [Lachnospiraceae bacterium]
DQGLSILSDMTNALEKAGKKTLSGDDAFKLYDTYGFPLDLTKEILLEKGFDVDEEGFKSAMEVQRETARNAREESNFMGADVTVYQSIDANISSEFVGYDNYKFDSEVTVLTTNTEIVDSLSEGMYGTVIVNQSPFYATMGGQCADIGVIETDTAVFRVEDTLKINGDKIGHYGKVEQGTLSLGETVRLSIDENNRTLTAKNHSATHLLQKALRMVLGNHVQQAGSMVDSSKLRFDFTHFSPVTSEEIVKIENIVNDMIEKNLSVDINEMSIDDARKTGATALFGEKYGDTVRVVNMGDFSIELCGGTHVSETGCIRAFKIISESGIASGVRRIEALTDKAVFDYYRDIEDNLNSVAKALKSDCQSAVKKAEALNEELRALRSENESLKMKLINSSLDDKMENVQDINGVSFIPVKLEGADMNSIRNMADSIKEKSGYCVIVIASVTDGKVNLLTMASDGAVKKGAHAGNLIKSIASMVGGGGGGRPNMAQAGGKDPSGVDKALDEAAKIVENQLLH